MIICSICSQLLEENVPMVFVGHHPDPSTYIWFYEVWECPECGNQEFVLQFVEDIQEWRNDRLPY